MFTDAVLTCTHNLCVCLRFYQWYQWYTNIVQGSTNGSIGNTIGTNGNANGTIGSPNGTIGSIGKPMVPLATNGTIGKITNGTIGRNPNRANVLSKINTLRERLRVHKVFTKDQCFYLHYHKFSIKSYVVDVY